jgi:glycosyltransferase involved in cell wall biosynthesis
MPTREHDHGCDLSVVIPCRNGGRLLAEQLEALARQEWPGSWEVIVADNGSTDDSVEVVRGFEGRVPGLRVVDASDRPGQAHARNVGVRESRGRLLLFVDADDVVGDGYVAEMAGALDHRDYVCGRLEFERLNPRWVLDVHTGTFPDGIPNAFGFLPHAPAGTTGICRSVFDRLGGFDETTPPFEDLDLCWRAQLSGIPLLYVPEAVYHYRLRHSLLGMACQSWAFGRATIAMRRRFRHYLPAGPTGSERAQAWVAEGRSLARIRSKAEAYRLVVGLATRGGKIAERLSRIEPRNVLPPPGTPGSPVAPETPNSATVGDQ